MAPSRPAALASAKESCASLCLGKQVSHTETDLSSQDALDCILKGIFSLDINRMEVYSSYAQALFPMVLSLRKQAVSFEVG